MKELDAQIEGLRPRLLSAVRAACPSWMAADAEDIAQEALVRVAKNLEEQGERDRELPASYLRRTAYHAVVDAIRARRSRQDQEIAMETVQPDPSGPSATPERLARANETGQAILDCLAGIVRARRLSVTLYLQGHTVPEIGRLLEWSTTRVNNLVYRGLADLRRCLEGKGVTP